jgi:hypothetical protein
MRPEPGDQPEKTGRLLFDLSLAEAQVDHNQATRTCSRDVLDPCGPDGLDHDA